MQYIRPWENMDLIVTLNMKGNNYLMELKIIAEDDTS